MHVFEKKQYLAWHASNHTKSQTFLRRKFLKICLLILSMTPPSAACRFRHRSQCSSPCSCERPKQTRKCIVPPPLWAGPCATEVSGIPSGTQNKVLINMWAGPCAAGVSGTTSGMDEDKVLINMWKQNLESGEELGSQAGPLQSKTVPPIFPVPHGSLLARGFHYRLPSVAEGLS